MNERRANVGNRGSQNRTRLTSYCDRVGGDRFSAGALCIPRRYWAANTNGTLTVVAPLEAGKCQARTRLVMQRESPGYPRGSPLLLALWTLPEGATWMLTDTRAVSGASLVRADSAGCQHDRFTLPV